MRVTIVSSYDEVCGNATYAEALRRLLEADFDEVTVTGLNTFLLQNRSSIFRRAQRHHIDELCTRIQQFDHVNFQVELGLYGSTPSSAASVLRRLLDAARHASLTMHRIDPPQDARGWFVDIMTAPKKTIEQQIRLYRHNAWSSVYVELLALARSRNFTVIVHTKRDAELIGYLVPGTKVEIHPICFSTPCEISAVRSRSRELSDTIKKRLMVDDDSVLLGVFGFISSYKMVEVAIEALRFLPKRYKLLIVGGVHPHGIKPNEALNPYIDKLWKTIRGPNISVRPQSGANFLLPIAAAMGKGSSGAMPGALGRLAEAFSDSVEASRLNMSSAKIVNRVFFIAHATDKEMNELIAGCDFSVLPYMETGQSGSGIAALSLEYAQRIVTSNNLAFLELGRFAPEAFAMADIGFAKGFADAVLGYRAEVHAPAQAAFNAKFNGLTNAAVYRAAARQD